ncbi:MAG: hypothetical protein GX536_08470, partial [Actinobacteria bacterium]|nr:hypothetical protein [Actinomycetota bacterium]
GWYRCNGTLNRVDLTGERCSAKIVKGEHLEVPIWRDIERFLRDPGDIIAELSTETESQAAADTLAREREHWQAALHEHHSRRERLLDLYQNGFITRPEFEERLQTVEDGRSEAQRRLEGLEPPDEAEAAEPLPDDLLAEIRRRLDAGLTDAERAEIIRLLVRKVTVFTDVGEDGRKRQRVLVDYRFSVGGLTHTGRDSWQQSARNALGNSKTHCAG